ncbi:right-handed parallel beta-helix repeat-containing protein, partial [Candidatus Woesearchaeota archaeon]|nr:right-handed parallel beta-helix repeat-containing protein [Candidatus Woesearchaeota archaeon]
MSIPDTIFASGGIIFETVTADNIFDANNISIIAPSNTGFAFFMNVSVNFTATNNIVSAGSNIYATIADAINVTFTNLTIESENGSIRFPGSINITGVQNISINSYNLSNNSAFINSTNLTFFNTSAFITLNNLGFTNAVPIVDFTDLNTYTNCTTDVCTNTSYDGSTFKFNVSHWTTFKAEEFVPAAGALNSSCGDITQTTVLNASVNASGTCFNITNDNLTLNCNGHTITYDLSGLGNVSGVTALNKVNITVRNCVIRDGNESGSFGMAINLTSTNNSLILNNSITTNGTNQSIGIMIAGTSRYDRIEDNRITTRGADRNNFGIWMVDERDSNVTSNIISTNGTHQNHGIKIETGTNITVRNNTIAARGTANQSTGITLSSSTTNSTVESNAITTDGERANYGVDLTLVGGYNRVLRNAINTSGTSDINVGVHVSTSSNQTIDSNVIRTNGTHDNYGIRLEVNIFETNATNNTIVTNGTAGSNHGFLIQSGASRNLIAENTITTSGVTNDNRGIALILSALNNTLRGNVIVTGPRTSYNQHGITSQSDSMNNQIINNTITVNGENATYGIRLNDVANITIINNTLRVNGTASNAGIRAVNTNQSVILHNFIRVFGNQSQGIDLHNSSDNTFTNTNITAQGIDALGFYLEGSNGTQVSTLILDNPSNWLIANVSTFNNFTNTTFSTGNGSIQFPGLVALNGSLLLNHSALDITLNRSFSNSSNHSAFNRSANIVLSGLAFTNAQAVVDYTDSETYSTCPADVCTNTSYDGSTFKFNVSHWTTFAAQEATVEGANSTSMQLTKRDTQDPVTAGTSLTFNVTINNTGTDTAYNVTLTEIYNANVTFSSGQPVPVGATNDTFIIGNLTSGQVYVMNVTVTVNGTVFNGSLINNTVNISWFNTSGLFNTLNTTINTTVTGDLKADACQTLALPGTYRVSQNLSVFGNFSTCFNLTTNDINLNCDGFTLRGNRSEGQHGINASALNNLTVQNCVITNFTDGLVFSRVRNATIYNNTALNNSDDGFDIRSTNFSVISFNNATKNFDTNILLAGGWYNNFTNNTVDNARGDIYSNGFTVTSNSKENRFVNNTALSNQNTGILITQSDNNSVLNNTAFANGEDGIVFNQSLTNVMRGNLVRNNSDDGIVVDTSNFSVIDMNNASRNGDNNIILFQSNNNNVTNNTASLAAGAGFNNGIAVSNISNSNRIINNTMADNSDDGLQLIRSNDSVVAFNRVINNGDDGIDISNDTGHNISFNYIQGNFLGIALTPGFGIWIENNTITNNTNDGIFIARHSENSTIIRNLITDHLASGGAGINLYTNNSPNHNITIIHNIINGTGDHGIVVLNLSQNISVVNNTIRFAGMSNPSGSGIYARDVKNLNITGNNISNVSDTGIWVNMVENLTIAFNNITGASTFIRVNLTNNTLIRANTLQNTNLTSLQLLNASNTTLLDSQFKNYTLTSSGITIRTSGLGQIEFNNRSMTVTGTNFTNETRITTNNLTVKNSAFNSSANLTLNGLTFTNAVALVDAEDDGTYLNCTSDVCTNTSYDGSTFKFNVSHWTTFASEEATVIATLTYNFTNLSATKTDLYDPSNTSSLLNYTILINVTNGTAHNITVNETYSADIRFVSATPSPVSGTNTSFIIGNLSNGSIYRVNITVLTLNITNGTIITNNVNVSFFNESGGYRSTNATATTTVLANITLNRTSVNLTKTDAPDPVNINTYLNYTILINVTNGTASNITLSENYSTSVRFNHSSPNPVSGTNG